ncbi:PQQ-dependent sugar dehydrogenase [Lysinibacillus odysseyi]|uniref:Quinoprotein glucose dehydrogenase n=1 Tax=Lysinibacillus odysseyi 34hs-1 = NBRC 100172 TaxID=1220589 RepID=A0A0A3IJZ3_9BACI|nr:quinoprotein glucose dehydrogenase [Lysinibacillus odysseyi 34hs-1 = NBRC 100172]
MKQLFLFILLTVTLLAGCSKAEKTMTVDRQSDAVKEQGNQKPEVIMENLEVPWSIEKLGDTFYLTERPGHIVKIENGKMERYDLELQKKLSTAAEAGLLGFVLAPDFQDSNRAYAYYTYEDNGGQFNRVVTLRLEDGIWTEEKLLLDHIPSGSYHHGGRLKIGPDGKLYATTGDATRREIAQDINSLGGKILRMNVDGTIPHDNPFPNSYVYSYGHRNPQGVTWSPDGELFASEHGNNANDEINRIEAGKNYGWPLIEGHEEQEGMVSPLFTSGAETTWAPSGMDYYDGKLYVAALRGTAVLAFDPGSGEQKEIITGLGRIRDVLIDEAYLYFITNNTDGRGNPQKNGDKLYRLPLSELE